MDKTWVVRRIREGDALSLMTFYNQQGEASKRTFHPLGDETTLEICEAIVRDNLCHPDNKLDLVAFVAAKMVGWSFIHQLQGEHPFFGLSVDDRCQGQGLGSTLMDAVMDAARRRGLERITLTVVQDNLKAQGLYTRRGFVREDDFIAEDGLPYYRMVAHPGTGTGT